MTARRWKASYAACSAPHWRPSRLPQEFTHPGNGRPNKEHPTEHPYEQPCITAYLRDDNPSPLTALGPAIAKDIATLAQRDGSDLAAVADAWGFDSAQDMVDMAGPASFQPPAGGDAASQPAPAPGQQLPSFADRYDGSRHLARFDAKDRQMQPGQLVPDNLLKGEPRTGGYSRPKPMQPGQIVPDEWQLPYAG